MVIFLLCVIAAVLLCGAAAVRNAAAAVFGFGLLVIVATMLIKVPLGVWFWGALAIALVFATAASVSEIRATKRNGELLLESLQARGRSEDEIARAMEIFKKRGIEAVYRYEATLKPDLSPAIKPAMPLPQGADGRRLLSGGDRPA